MKWNEKTIKGIFDKEDLEFVIPDYQRAYSWEEPQLKEFFNDLIEHEKANKDYYFGNIIVKEVVVDEKFDVIDGQQRLTTITLFAKAVIDFLKKEGKKDFDYEKEKRLFVKSSCYKLQPVSYDKGYYDNIIDEQNSLSPQTPSQKRIEEALKYFTKEIEKLNNVDLVLSLYKKMKNSKVSFSSIENEGEAILLFELQNNRGKNLTNLEKIRSFLMYKMYNLSSDNDLIENLAYIKNLIDPIYSIIMHISQKVNYDEDDILLYHCYAFTKYGMNYRNTDDLFDLKKEFEESNDKIKWIKDFVSNLNCSFNNAELLFSFKSTLWNKIKELSSYEKIPAYIFAFMLRGMKYISNNENDLLSLIDLLEEIRFREQLIHSRAKIYEKINKDLLLFNGNIELLKQGIYNSISSYWNDVDVIEKLTHNMYSNDMLNYILHNYEESIQNKGYELKSLNIIDEAIEHISPQTEPDEIIKSGYETDENGKYSDEFREKYLNYIGNLMLISKSHNSSIGNDVFINKLNSYINNPILMQQMEIKDFVSTVNGIQMWNSDSIKKRGDKILNYIFKRWKINGRPPVKLF